MQEMCHSIQENIKNTEEIMFKIVWLVCVIG